MALGQTRPNLNLHVIILANNNYKHIPPPYAGVFFLYKIGRNTRPDTLCVTVFTHGFLMQYKPDLILI